MAGNGLFVPTFIPCHRLANDTPQFLIEGLGKLKSSMPRCDNDTHISTATIVIAFLSYFLMHDVCILVTFSQS
jgi:hypothetical protein